LADPLLGSVALGLQYSVLSGRKKNVTASWKTRRRAITAGTAVALLVGATVAGVLLPTRETQAGWFGHWGKHGCGPDGCVVEGPPIDEVGGTWYWLHSPDEEKRVIMGLYNRYCIRCHGVDGRGVWDIPDVPDFANVVWQTTRPDDYRTRVILEGRGAVMPAFRGTLTLEEACAMARYLHTFTPGNEVSRPGLGPAEAAPGATARPAAGRPVIPPPVSRVPAAAAPTAPATTNPGPFGR